MDVLLHKSRFVEVSPSGVTASALHPEGAYLAIARGQGDIELWQTDGQCPPKLPASTADPAAGSGWNVVASIPGSADLSLHCLSWVPGKSRVVPGIDGCRLFIGSLDGRIYEADWLSRRVRHSADSNAGSVWSLSALPLAKVGGAVGGGTLLAAGCEDGSIRLLRVDSQSIACEHVIRLPGTEGRVLSCAWHPQQPVLFAGTATGAVRGFDLTGIAQEVITSMESQHAARSAEAAARAHARAAGGAGVKGAKRARADSSSSDSSSDSDISVSNTRGDGSARGATVGPAAVVQFRVDPHALGKKGKGQASCVWSLAVTRDLTVFTADSSGAVQAWDGRTGVLASGVPLVRHTGDALTLALVEGGAQGVGGEQQEGKAGQGAKSTVVLASGGVDGRVVVVTSVASEGPQRAWTQLGAHSAHVAGVRTVFLGGRGNVGGRGNLWVASGGADGNLASLRLSELASPAGGPGPRIHGASSGLGLGLVCTSGQAGLLAAHHGAAVKVWGMRKPTGKRTAGQAGLDPQLLLQVDTPTVPGSDSLPVHRPACCALSHDGHWLAYASARDAVPRLVFLQHTQGHDTDEIQGLQPRPVRVLGEEALQLALNNAARRLAGYRASAMPGTTTAAYGAQPGPPSMLQFLQSGGHTLLVMVSCGRLYVLLCTASHHEVGDEGPSAITDTATAQAAYAYSLPIPLSAQGEHAIRAEANGTAKTLLSSIQSSSTAGLTPAAVATTSTGGAGSVPKRKRSNTGDSAGLASAGASESEYAGSADGEDSEGEGSRGGSSSHHSSLSGHGSAAAALCLPLALAARDSTDGPALLLVGTHTRHAHVFRLQAKQGELALTLPRLPTTLSAAAFIPATSCALLALRDASLLAYDCSSGTAMPWSMALSGPGGQSKTVTSTAAMQEGAFTAPLLPKAWQVRVKADPLMALVPLTRVQLQGTGHMAAGTSMKLLGVGRNTVVTLSVDASGAAQGAAGAASSGKGSKSQSTLPPAYAVHASIGDGFEHVLGAGLACPQSRLAVCSSAGSSTAGESVAVPSVATSGKAGKKGKAKAVAAAPAGVSVSTSTPVEVTVVHVSSRAVYSALGVSLQPSTVAAKGKGEAGEAQEVRTSAAVLARMAQSMKRGPKYGRG